MIFFISYLLLLLPYFRVSSLVIKLKTYTERSIIRQVIQVVNLQPIFKFTRFIYSLTNLVLFLKYLWNGLDGIILILDKYIRVISYQIYLVDSKLIIFFYILKKTIYLFQQITKVTVGKIPKFLQLKINKMQQIGQQQAERIYTLDNKYVVGGWQKVNPKNKLKQIPLNQVQVFMKYVFDKSKYQLSIEIQEDINFNQIIEDYRESTKQTQKQLFTFEEAVDLLNWAVQGDQGQQVKQQQPQQQRSKQREKREKSHKEQQNQIKNSQRNLITQPALSDNKQIKIQNKYTSHSNNQNLKAGNKNDQRQRQAQSSQMQGNKVSNPNKSIELTDAIKLDFEILIGQTKEDSKIKYLTGKKPLSIKKSLARLQAQSKNKKIIDIKKTKTPLSSLPPEAPQIRYIQKLKLVIRNKKPKAEYHPEKTGLKQLFKLYCGLNSQIHNIRNKGRVKGTFEDFQKRSNNLYMHNFMLFCKDFNLLENKSVSKPVFQNCQQKVEQKLTNINPEPQKQNAKDNSKGDVSQSLSQQVLSTNLEEQKSHQNSKHQRLTHKQNARPWDRDQLSKQFKKQSDYKLNVKYNSFIELLKTILKDKIIMKESKTKAKLSNTHKDNLQPDQKGKLQAQNQIEDEKETKETSKQQDSQKQNNQNQQETTSTHTQKQAQTDCQILSICEYLRLDNQPNYEQTMERLKVIHKILEPATGDKRIRKNVTQVHNGQFQQSTAETLKLRQNQKRIKHIEIRQKYLNKYSSPQVDSYSSFKSATTQVNNMNSLYGSAPKLNLSKINGKVGSYNQETDSSVSCGLGRKAKGFNEYGLVMGSVIKQARSQLSEQSKHGWNRLNKSIELSPYIKNMSRSRFGPAISQQHTLGYKRLNELKPSEFQDGTLSSILLNNSRLVQQGTRTNRPQKSEAKAIQNPMLQHLGCHEDDDLLNKYFDQQKAFERSQPILGKLR